MNLWWWWPNRQDIQSRCRLSIKTPNLGDAIWYHLQRVELLTAAGNVKCPKTDGRQKFNCYPVFKLRNFRSKENFLFQFRNSIILLCMTLVLALLRTIIYHVESLSLNGWYILISRGCPLKWKFSPPSFAGFLTKNSTPKAFPFFPQQSQSRCSDAEPPSLT